MLDITKVQALLFSQLPHLNELFSFLIEFALHFIEITIKHRHRLFQVVDLLVFSKEFALVCLDIVDKNGFVCLTTARSCHCLLQSLQKFVLGMIEVFDE